MEKWLLSMVSATILRSASTLLLKARSLHQTLSSSLWLVTVKLAMGSPISAFQDWDGRVLCPPCILHRFSQIKRVLVFGFAWQALHPLSHCDSFWCDWVRFLSTWHMLESSEKRNRSWENASIRLPIGKSLRAFSWFMTNMGRPSLLAVPYLGRWSWIF